MKIQISHMTRYRYEEPVFNSVNEVRLTPRTNDRQSCHHHSVFINPTVPLFTYEDYFGNRVYSFSIADPHDEIVIETHSIVATYDEQIKNVQEYPLDEELKILASEQFQNDFAEYLTNTTYTFLTPEIQAFTEDTKNSSEVTSVYQIIENISRSIYTQFKYDPEATDVQTTVADTFKLKRGVCQDFAHLMISMCKSLGIPARYVSGYHFVGDLQGGHADFEQASHAWIEVYVPEIGWLGFDPTNNGKVNWRYVKIGHGRDYKDIVPIKGSYLGVANQTLEIAVDVQKLEN